MLDNSLKDFTKLDENHDKQINLKKIDLIIKINNKSNNLDEIFNKNLERFNNK